MWQLRRIILIVRHKDLLHTQNLGSASVIFILFCAFAANVFLATGTHEINQGVINIIRICHNLTLQQLRAQIILRMAFITSTMLPSLFPGIFHRNIAAATIRTFPVHYPGNDPDIIRQHAGHFIPSHKTELFFIRIKNIVLFLARLCKRW